MAFERGKGRGTPRGFGGEGRSFGPKKEFGDRPRKPYAPRGEGESRGGSEDRPRRAYGPKKAFGDKPAYGEKRSYGERKPYAPRAEGEGRSYGPKKEFGDRPQRSYGPKKDFGDRPRKPYAPRGEGEDRGGFEDRPRRPYTPRGEGEGRSYGPRKEFGDRPQRSYGPKKDFGDRPRKPYAPRGEGEERSYGDRPQRSYGPKKDFGEGAPARFDAKREVKRPRKTAEERAAYLDQQDGWLVGLHAVTSALKSGRRTVRSVWLLGEAKGELAAVLAAHPEWPVEVKAKPDFESQFGELVHQGVAALVGNLPQPSLPELLATKPQLIVALDQVTDPHNLGAVIRSCAAFGAKGVLVTEDRAAGLTPTVAKAAAGALETVPVVEIVNLAQSLKMLQENGFTVLGMAGEAETDLASLKVTGPVCLVVGSEGDGLRRLTRETCDQLVKIAISSDIESLNVSVATGIALAKLGKAL